MSEPDAEAHQLNERCIEVLGELAGDAMMGSLPDVVSMSLDLWRGLHVEERKRLAEFPFVMIDIRFRDSTWWNSFGRRVRVPTKVSIANCLPPDRCEDLLHETLMFAWQAAREDISVAQMIFAMTRPVASRIATLAMRDIRALATASAPYLRISWDEDPEFWRELLGALRDTDETAFAALRFHATSLFCGELVGSARFDVVD